MSDADARAKERLVHVAEQINRIISMAEPFDIECPYCGSITQYGKTFCCTKMMNAVGVIVEAIEKFRSIETRHLVN